MVGICGIAMGTLAQMLADSGYDVSGSDENVYPPMSVMLSEKGIRVMKGYRAENLSSPDLVIIGNAISRGNPEVEAVLDGRIHYVSMAQAIRTFFLSDREVVAVTGTHGKSTTTALLAHMLGTAGFAPSYLVGGVSRNSGSNYGLGSGRHFVIEGDEYDSAFFEKVPKFIFYKPTHLIITSLEYDHADIYSGLDEIELWFRRLVNTVPSEGSIVYCADYGNIPGIVSGSFSRNFSFSGRKGDLVYGFDSYDGEFSVLDLACGGSAFRVRTRLFGDFNYSNIAAAASMCLCLGMDRDAVADGIESFMGVKRRQEIIYRERDVIIYEDFAHHPTAIKSVLESMRERHPGHSIWAVFEPRSATSRRSVFQEELPGAFRSADTVIFKTPYDQTNIKKEDRLDIERLMNDIRSFNDDVHVFLDVDGIIEFISGRIDPSGKNVVVIMSNGGFDGIYGRIKSRLDKLMIDPMTVN
ncbi:MAG: Mur ligase domain-containing protein [Spirochaetes bacterium]|jgi:UDP-N-acetylmuramate: L-alanyl-gamma-D-glutamyl-meso-diaminopimelate ligase|nr:Mur ligase domain-containing protein [Spirochaetota bacterium]